MSGVVVDGFDRREGGEVIGFIVELNSVFRRRRHVADADRVLDEPFVDGFRWVSHEDATLEVRVCKDVGQRGGMVNVETGSHTLVWRNQVSTG